jgi:hypothetical protein
LTQINLASIMAIGLVVDAVISAGKATASPPQDVPRR